MRRSTLLARRRAADLVGRLHRGVGRRRRSQQQADDNPERRGVREVVHGPTEPQTAKHTADHLAQKAVALAYPALGGSVRGALRRALGRQRVEPGLEALKGLLALIVRL